MSHGRTAQVEKLIEKFLGSTDTSDPKVRKKLKKQLAEAEAEIARLKG